MNLQLLHDLAEFVMGQAPPGEACNERGEGTPFVKAGEFGEEGPVIREWTTKPLKLARRTDVLVCVVGATSGKVNLGADCAIGRSVAAVRPKEGKLDQRFALHFLRTQTPRLRGGSQGTAQGVITREMLGALLVPGLSLPEQRRIADILDEADAIRRKRKAAIALTEELLRSAFFDMFGDPVTNPKGWPSSTFGEEVEHLEYGPRFYDEKYSDIGVRIVRITDLSANGDLDFASMPRLAVTEVERARYLLRPGDVLFARSGATVGKTAISMPGDPPAIPGAYFIKLRFKSTVTSLFARQVLASERVQHIIATRSRQSAQQNFSGPGIRELPLPLPPTALQRRLDEVANAQRGLLASLRRADVDSESLFCGLTRRAFVGELHAR